MTLDFTRKEGGTIPMVFFAVTSSIQLAIGMVDKQPGRIRLGLLLLMATTMVKLEGAILFGLWCILLLLDKDCRAVFWPVRRILLTVVAGVASWLPYLVLRLEGTAPNTESAWPGQLIHNTGTVLGILPMNLIAFLSRRFFNSDFASWGAPDNQHAVWQGKWDGLASFVDQATLGVGWACLLVLILACLRGGKLRWTALKLFLVFIGFTFFLCIVWSSARSNPLVYNDSLAAGSDTITGGRYLYPVFMSWFVAGFVLLVRAKSDQPVLPVLVGEKDKSIKSKANRRAR